MNAAAKTVIGAVAWLAFLLSARSSPFAPSWTLVLLVFSALVLLPLALDLAAERRDTGKIGRSLNWVRVAHLPAAAALAVACGMRPGLWALLVAVPWAAITALLASIGVGRMLRDGFARPLDRLCVDVGLAFLVVGGLWLLADRGGIRPLRFDAEVVALTAAHFHFAGFLLPIFGGCVLRQNPDSRFAARAVVGVVLGVPAVAAGITVTQLGGTPAVEAAAGCGLALSALIVGILQVRFALDAKDATGAARALIGISGVALFFGMLLAFAYAIRSYAAPLPWLTLPAMRAVHGSTLALGFGLCGALGWRMEARRQPPSR